MKRPEAKYEATSMIQKKREVQDGHYAVLEIDNIDSVKYYYYKRDNNNWVRDETIPENSFFGSNELFCNIQNKCIQIDKKCADPAVGTDLVKKDLIREMYDEFRRSDRWAPWPATSARARAAGTTGHRTTGSTA